MRRRLVIVLSLLVVASVGADSSTSESKAGAIYYIAPSGSDAAPCSQQQPCQTFDRGYHVAHAGDTVLVSAGTYAVTDPPAGATRITPDGTKHAGPNVLFACRGNGDVTFSAPNFTIQAAYLAIKGGCFHFHILNLSQPGDDQLNASYITVDGVHMESFASHGSDHSSIVNSEVGPNVACQAQGTTGTGENGGPITPAMWCDPNGPPYESIYAATGNTFLWTEPFIHGNLGRETTYFTLANNRIHDIQTKDSFNLHTGGLLILEARNSPLVIRGNVFQRDAVYDIEGDPSPSGVVLEDNWFGSAVEPLSSGFGPGKELVRAEVENVLRPGGQTTLTGWTVRRNSFDHGYAPNSAGGDTSFQNVVVSKNIFAGGGCSPGKPGIEWTENLAPERCDQAAAVPFGYVLGRGRLTIDPKRGKAVAIAFATAAREDGTAAVRKSLRHDHVPAPRGGWSAKNLHAILFDPVYLGGVFGAPGAHPHLVTYKLWRKAQKTLTHP